MAPRRRFPLRLSHVHTLQLLFFVALNVHMVSLLYMSFHMPPLNDNNNINNINNNNIAPMRTLADSNNHPNNQNNNHSSIIISPRIWSPWNNDFPCFPAEGPRWFGHTVQTSPIDQGFVFIKPFKTASSTAVGVHLRIAQKQARIKHYPMCRVRFDHVMARNLMMPSNNGENANNNMMFRWTVLRDPTARAISQFFHFSVGRHKVEPNDVNFQHALLSEKVANRNYYLQILNLKRRHYDHNNTTTLRHMTRQILNDYHFIAITERLDESLVVLQLLLHLNTADILYLSAKHQGSFDDGAGKKHCYYIPPSFVSPEMQHFFTSPEWQTRIQYDQLLYQAANQSLDLTIDHLGPPFATALQQFRQAQRVIQQRCLPRAISPCSSGGTYHNVTNCLWNDSGCANDCIDQVATELGLLS